MNTIHKYSLNLFGDTYVPTYLGAVALDIQQQNGVPVLWALVDPGAPAVTRVVRPVGTGHAVTGGEYIKTVQVDGGLVLHMFW